VAMEHRRHPSSAYSYWHRQMQWRAVADEQNQPWQRSNDRARRCERREGPAVGHGAAAPVAMEHRRSHRSLMMCKMFINNRTS